MDHVLPDNVVLTGFMGTGKTTVGRLLAGLLGYGLVDTDAMVVISTGGRTMLEPGSAAALGATARVFCLVASATAIAERLLVDGTAVERPLLAGPNPRQRIEQLLAERADGDAQFEQVVTDGRTPTQVAADIFQRLTE